MSEYGLFRKQSLYDSRLSQAAKKKKAERKALLERIRQQRRKLNRKMLYGKKSLKSRYFLSLIQFDPVYNYARREK